MAKNPIQESIFIFSETFGDKTNPAIVLNAGSGGQSIFWPDSFYKGLADRGYFVIRYDYRDTGLSSATDYEKNPYTAMDLSKDVVRLLEKYKVQKATCVGFSMGGQVCQFLGAYFPELVDHLVLISTSPNFKAISDAMEGRPHTERLSAPLPEYVALCRVLSDLTQITGAQKIDLSLNLRRCLAGGYSGNFDETFFRKSAQLYRERSQLHNTSIPHMKAQARSFHDHQCAPALITAPTLIIHGDRDPVFPLDHGKDLHKKIKNSELVVFKDFGHTIIPAHSDRLIQEIDEFLRKTPDKL